MSANDDTGEDTRGRIGIAEPPLTGVRILSAEQFGAGPFASMYLSDMGADVIKIEPPPSPDGPGGDTSRQTGPYFAADNDSLFFQAFNLGKRSLTLDLRRPKGQDVFRRLVARADAVLNNLRGDQPEKLGLTYEALASIKPSIVCAHLSGYGRIGERATWPAYDYLAQAEAGFLSLTGEPDGPQSRMGLPVIDLMTGVTTALALTSALFAAARTGKGRNIDVTLYDVAMHQLTYPASWYLNEGVAISRRPRSGHPTIVPCEMFPTRNGSMFVMCILPKFWQRLCRLIGLPELPADPKFASNELRYANRDELAARLDAVFQSETTQTWLSRLTGQIPVAPVLQLGEALDNPYFQAGGGLQAVDHYARPGLEVVSNPIRLDGARAKARPGPRLGEHTDAILSEIGLAASDIATLRAERIV